ncbi:MAG: YkgJ family cysteine cluster protein [Myxococcaceae bacterium]|nr:YkgJ family cysteine cluster protein [Myxococcaceae bacterium]
MINRRAIAERREEQETRAVYRLADALYAPYSCPATAECCQLTRTRRQPWLWPSEWRVLREGVLKTHGVVPLSRPDGACPLLDATGKHCTVYANRPFGCRTFFCHRIRGPSQQPVIAMNGLLERLERINQREDDELPAEPLQLLEWFAREQT